MWANAQQLLCNSEGGGGGGEGEQRHTVTEVGPLTSHLSLVG